MAALEQLDRLLELQRRREHLAQMVPPGIETSQQVFDNGSVIYRFSHEELGNSDTSELRLSHLWFRLV